MSTLTEVQNARVQELSGDAEVRVTRNTRRVAEISGKPEIDVTELNSAVKRFQWAVAHRDAISEFLAKCESPFHTTIPPTSVLLRMALYAPDDSGHETHGYREAISDLADILEAVD